MQKKCFFRFVVLVCISKVLLLTTNVFAQSVEIWSDELGSYSPELSSSSPILAQDTLNAFRVKTVTSEDKFTYIAFLDQDASRIERLFFARNDGQATKYWDFGKQRFVDNREDLDPIKNDLFSRIRSFHLAIDSKQRVYVVIAAENENGYTQLYLAKFDGGQFLVWNRDSREFVEDLSRADSISNATLGRVETGDDYESTIGLGINSKDQLYISFIQDDANTSYIQ